MALVDERQLRLEYPTSLPISARKDEIVRTLADNQVLVVAGETGSGKSTQLPKMCLELGRGAGGSLIGHTQPRRLAARTIAERLADELHTGLGDLVGYTVRFTDRVSGSTRVKVMTDGILLAELQRDRDLRRYDTLIVDEAHERSLNIDFILGYLAQLLPRRPDLKLIITSATIDTARFSAHFGGAPVIEVSGRSFPVEVRYRPLVDDDEDLDRDQVQAVCDAVIELAREGPGDILVFLSGEREIRDTADAIARLRLPDLDILPLYARLSMAEQHRVFAPHDGRRVVLATNVAETSLTVPGIRYVVDAGTARISRYNRRTKVQRLPIEEVSRASANQRAGRCGRVAPGICIRLYSEEDLAARPEFTEPEILRTNLASVILQMAAIGLGDVARFPFVDPPDARSIRDGVALLEELGALEVGPEPSSGSTPRLTKMGRRLAQLPVDPRLGRMVLEADRNGCVHEVMVLAAALSLQDPRERPMERRAAADELHARFADPSSDFVALLNLWSYLQEQQDALSSSQFRRMCRSEFLNYLRVREWQDVYAQLRQVTRSMGVRRNAEPAGPDAVHRSLLAGLLSHIGLWDDVKRDYLGARNARFAIGPGSGLFRKPPRWVMAAELVETTRLWARVAARIQPAWVEPLAGDLAKRSYGEVDWDGARGSAMTVERVTLYGIPIVAGRRVNLGRVDADLARELFIRHALVEREWEAPHAFLAQNDALIEEIRALEDRTRRPGLLAGEEARFEFYDERVGADVVSGAHFDRWWKQRRQRDPDLLTFTREQLLVGSPDAVDPAAWPDAWTVDGADLTVSYRFEPGSEDDGVTVFVPIAVLNRLRPEPFEWQVPGLRAEVVTGLIRSLPKALRRNFVPAPDVAREVAAAVSPDDGPLLEVLARELGRRAGVAIPFGSWDLAALPPHLRVTFVVVDEEGAPVARGKELRALQHALRPRVREAIVGAVAGIEKSGRTSWQFGSIPRVVESPSGAHTLRAFPALVDEGGAVGLRVFDDEAEQAVAMRDGTRRLLQLTVPSPRASTERRLPNRLKLALAASPYPSAPEVLEDCLRCALDDLVDRNGGPAWDEESFRALRARVASQLPEAYFAVVVTTARIVAAARALEAKLDRLTTPALSDTVADVGRQLSRLVYPGFVGATGAARLADVLRYLGGIVRRLDKVGESLPRDRERMARVRAIEAEYERAVASLPPARRAEPAVRDLRWQIEELRLAEFAQSVRTRGPVSEARIRRVLHDLTAPR